MTPPAPIEEQLRQEIAVLRRTLEQMAERDEQRAALTKAAAVALRLLERKATIHAAAAANRPGRPLAKITPSFRQDVLRLRDEKGWGRPRIAQHMRVSEAKVRRVLEEAAGENPSARRRSS